MTVLLAGVQPDMWTVLQNVGLERWFSGEHVFPEEDEEFSATLKAVRYAHAQLGVHEPHAPVPVAAAPGSGDAQRYYYLV